MRFDPTLWLLVGTVLLGAAALGAFAEETAPKEKPKMSPLKVGDRAPALRLNNQDGEAVALFDKAPGQPVALVFYPKALTGG